MKLIRENKSLTSTFSVTAGCHPKIPWKWDRSNTGAIEEGPTCTKKECFWDLSWSLRIQSIQHNYQINGTATVRKGVFLYRLFETLISAGELREREETLFCKFFLSREISGWLYSSHWCFSYPDLKVASTLLCLKKKEPVCLHHASAGLHFDRRMPGQHWALCCQQIFKGEEVAHTRSWVDKGLSPNGLLINSTCFQGLQILFDFSEHQQKLLATLLSRPSLSIRRLGLKTQVFRKYLVLDAGSGLIKECMSAAQDRKVTYLMHAY